MSGKAELTVPRLRATASTTNQENLKRDSSTKRLRGFREAEDSRQFDVTSIGAGSMGGQARIAELQNYVVNKIEVMKKTQANVKKLTQLAAFMPDFILQEDVSNHVPFQRSCDAVVFMVDVSGFTALTEAYSLKGKGGTDQLTKTLMSYISPLAESILLAEGDIVKYAGDAFLAFWTTNPDDYAEDVQRAIDCAIYIQEKYGSYLCKEVNITIKVKIGIGAGQTHLCWIGNDNYQHYVCFGPGVEAASAGEKHCSSGEVVLHPSTWTYCNPANYKATVKDDTYHVVTGIVNFLNPDKRGRPKKNALRRSLQQEGKKANYEELTRPVIAECVETKSEDFLRKFLILPVLKKLDDDIPLEYLNESRNICICFIHMDTVPMNHDGIGYRETMTQIVHKAFIKVYTTVTKLQGALTKAIMFDKGLTYLVVFGLPGFITENQCAHALKFSDSMRKQLLAIRHVNEVSIGVTTGSCWCGVLGHPRRQEYTVMGRKVNKAARLMCNYPDRVSCDQDTAYHSKLPQHCFELQEYVELKGIANPGKIYEYVPVDNTENQSITDFPYPMVGRDGEINFFRSVLLKCQRELTDYVKLSNMGKGSAVGKESIIAAGIWMVVFEGENGIGKSRMLAACIREAENQPNVRVFSVAMNLILSGQALFGLSALVMEAIGINDFRTSQEREDYLRKHVNEYELATELCVLNDILHVKFPLTAKYAALDVNAGHAYGQRVLSSLLRVLYPDELILFVIDDAHLLDSLSWEYFINLAKNPNMFCLAAIRKNAAGSPKLVDTVNNQLYHNKNVKVVRLNGLDPTNCLTMACQMMEVAGIPQDLEKILKAKSQGVPAWCDQVLHELLRTGVLKYSTSHKKTPMVYCDKKLLDKLEITKRRTQNAWLNQNESLYDQSETDLKNSDSMGMIRRGSVTGVVALQQSPEVDPKSRLLIVKSGTNIGHMQIHGTLHEILLDSYDELNSNEQIILKCASTMGKKFSKQMVTRILPFFELNAKKYEAGFNHLMEARYIRCASGVHSKASAKDQTMMPECFCKLTALDQVSRELGAGASVSSDKPFKQKLSTSASKRPKYMSCKFMEFVKETLVEVVYDLMTDDRRKECHLKAAKYLDSSVVRCESCGGGNSAYTFGIVLKTGEMGMMDNEDTIRAAANLRRPAGSKDADPNKTGHIGGRNITSITGASMMNPMGLPTGGLPMGLPMGLPGAFRKRRTSLTTQITGMKRSAQTNSKVAQIEYEILDLLRKIDHQEKRRYRFCGQTAEDDEAEKLLNDELHLLRDEVDHNIVNLKPTGGDDDADAKSMKEEKGDGESGHPSPPVDFRLCECAALHAKICIEMVKHYREAQKYGKCLVNLLDAAESIVTIGNGSQGLVHLEDAGGLMRAIKKGDLPAPDKDDQDDAKINEDEAKGQIEYLSGLAYFEIGVPVKAKDFFIKALARHGLHLSTDESKFNKEAAILKAKSQLWRSHFQMCVPKVTAKVLRKVTNAETGEEAWVKKVRILSYLHSIFRQDRKLELALLVALWEVIIAEQYGDLMQDVIPAYCNMMETHTAMSHHKDAMRYEKLSLNIIRHAFGSNEQLEPVGLLTTAHLFYVVATGRMCRGGITNSSDAAYLGLRIAQTVHDNNLCIRLLPTLIISLILGLRVTEAIEALQRLWYIADEEDDWAGVANYYTLCMDLLLNTAYPLESFGTCEHFVLTNDWASEGGATRDAEIQYSMESSLALWYARYSRWDLATKWVATAESHKPKLSTILSVHAELKLLETHLIFVNHYLDGKRYQHFAKARNAAKVLMRTLTKSIKIVPLMKPRFLHLMAYYYRIRSRNVESDNQLKMAEKAAIAINDTLEVEWIAHNRTVWEDMAIPTIKFFWLEHTESHVLDWHSSGKIPWANVMYSLPLPTWK